MSVEMNRFKNTQTSTTREWIWADSDLDGKNKVRMDLSGIWKPVLLIFYESLLSFINLYLNESLSHPEQDAPCISGRHCQPDI